MHSIFFIFKLDIRHNLPNDLFTLYCILSLCLLVRSPLFCTQFVLYGQICTILFTEDTFKNLLVFSFWLFPYFLAPVASIIIIIIILIFRFIQGNIIAFELINNYFLAIIACIYHVLSSKAYSSVLCDTRLKNSF